MLQERILVTLKFFDLQNLPLTLIELTEFLLPTQEELKQYLNERWEYMDEMDTGTGDYQPVDLDEVLQVLRNELQAEVETLYGFYCLKGRKIIIEKRWQNYLFTVQREKLIKRYISGARHLPFVRGIALLGSQALGEQKPESDIDLLTLVAPDYLWLARIIVTIYFQLTGLRRHGKKIANRFCLNHYLAAGEILIKDRNLYTAAEYLKLRPLVYPQEFQEFVEKNSDWISRFFPNFGQKQYLRQQPSVLQQMLERLLANAFGRWLNKIAKLLQLGRIDQGEFIVVSDSELSFHPNNRKLQLFQKFFS